MIADIRQGIIDAFPLTGHLAHLGIQLRGSGRERTANRCAAGQHRKDHWCVSVNPEKQLWHCNDHDCGGGIIEWLAIEQGKTETEIFKELAQELDDSNSTPALSNQLPTIIATYDYTDPQGNLLYQVVRYDPKSFRQRRPAADGGWIWNMDGITRVLYRLAEVLTAASVVVTEGEKDADNLRECGLVATCNVGGAGKWLSAYSEFLTGKEIIIIPDNDLPGKKHAESIVQAVDGKVASLKIAQVPAPYKDASDYIRSFPDIAAAAKAVHDLIDATPHTLKPLPVYTMRELESRYVDLVRQIEVRTFNLARFLPSLGQHVRKLIPGELVVIMSDTGVGKTAIQQAMARSTDPLPTLFFELELPGELMFERFVQMEINSTADAVETEYRALGVGFWKTLKALNHIVVCGESGLTTKQIESFICRSELKIGAKPVVVFVDYIGLLAAPQSRSRYEALSKIAEEMKIIAKRTNTIVVLGTQVARPEKNRESLEPRLHDAKDSGSIENSAGLVIGAWRPNHDTLMLKILKNTKGRTGAVIECNFDGQRMQISERVRPEFAP